ncbi:hypothetical protein SAMN02799624_05891 [Paenibacillus sp. UNC496MF]|uniref:hypothetical protein n=1 Tax=Paenibacillus sp. UNC496MF TaxID=1502753 RepID=UPI0008E98C15|nr:hypothetical protein [Paenibacillus sp. UNC496MF]SFJ77021.1 hypothetical protein SAMN02799624_05891 [Paenibacillus sp. UNC496MF]
MVSVLIGVGFSVGVGLIVYSMLFSVKLKRRLRIPSTRIKRRQLFQEKYAAAVTRENVRKSNYKVARRLKTAGNPFGMQVFHYNMLRLALPLVTILLMFVLRNSLNGYVTNFPIIPFIVIVLLSYATPPIFLVMFARQRREVLAEEIVKFSHRLIVCVTDKIPLYYAIRRAGRTCKVLKPYVDEMLIDWMNNPRAAINQFGEQIGINEVLPLTNTLLASWNAPEDKIINLFHQQIRNIDTMRDFQVKKKIEASPLRVTFVILIPFLVTGILCLLPWYMSFQATIQQIF